MKNTKTGFAVMTTIAIAFAGGSAFANKKGDYFKEMDGNSDGKVTAVEYDAAGTAKFTQADANGDGVLTKGELAGFMMDDKGKSGRKAEKKSDKKISKFDTNNDGSLTRQEFMDGGKEKFAKIDGDKDGSLTMEEMKKDRE